MSTQIVMLGTGTPRADPNRIGSCVAIVVNNQPYLVDFGPGLMLRAVQAHYQGIVSLDSKRLTRAFLTHLHADHCAGYADLIFTAWIQGRAQPLVVYGPPGLQAMTDHITTAYQISTDEHISAHPTDPDGWKVYAHEIEPGPIYSDENVQVEAFLVDHGDLIAYGYKFITPDKTIVISGDTRFCSTLVEAARDCDLLIHEVYSVAGLLRHEPAWQAYHQRVHTSAYDVGAIAMQTNAKLLILYHQLIWSATEDDLLEEVRRYYGGEVICAKDLDVL